MHCNLILENSQINEYFIEDLKDIFYEMEIEFIDVFSNYYILRLKNKENWNELLEKIGQKSDNFVMTPILEEGFYNGIINNGLWEKINKLTKHSVEDSNDVEEYY